MIHSGPTAETADKLYADVEALGTTIATLTITANKSNSTTTMANASIPANRLLGFFVTAVTGTFTDLTCTLRSKVPVA